MFKQILIVLCLISLSFSQTYTYAPWHLRNFDYSVSDFCSYIYSGFQYVKPCPVNFACNTQGSNSHGMSVCQEVFKTVKRFNEACSGDIECDSGLKCLNSKCISSNNLTPYGIKDRVSSHYYYYCNSDYRALDGSDCGLASNYNGMENLCYKTEAGGANPKSLAPKFGHVCGKTTWTPYSTPNNGYYSSQTEMNKIGSLDDGTFVQNRLACKSGFSLPLYIDKTLNKPNNANINDRYYVCVTLKEVGTDNAGNKVYRYSLDGKEYIYDTSQTSDSSYSSNIMTQLQLFKEYVEKAKGVTCNPGEGYDDEQFTCGNDELRRLWYFYNNVEEYLLYKNEDAIVDYLIQKAYPDYKPRYTEPTEGSGYLSIKFISLLILLLSL